MDYSNIKILQQRMCEVKIDSKKKRSQRYVPTSNYLLSFDIETTSWTDLYATMYDWTLGGADYNDLVLCKNNNDLKKCTTCVFGRTWNDFDLLCNILNGTAEDLNARFIILVYNLAYEWSYLQKNINFIRDNYNSEYPTVIEGKHSIMSVLAGNLVFLDATRLFGLGSLKQNAAKYGFEKLEYDYDVKRHFETPLDDKEIEYNENDVLITLGAWAMCLWNNGYKSIEGAPYTNTAMIKDVLKRNESVNKIVGVREQYRSDNKKRKNHIKKHNVSLFDEALDIATEVFPKEMSLEDVAKFLEAAFSGGFTHCNVFQQGNLFFNVASMDLGSAYPGAMMAAWYPRKLKVVLDTNKQFNRLMKYLLSKYDSPLKLAKATRDKLAGFAVVTVKLKDVSIINQVNGFTLPLISKHKLLSVSSDALFDNGKLVECSECIISCTTIDLLTWHWCYNYNIVECTQMLIGSDIQQLPQYWRNAVDYCYRAKTVLKNTLRLYRENGDWQSEYRKIPGIDDVEIKHVEDMEEHEAVYYLDMVLHQRKGELNGLYGIMVMHIVRRSYQYNEYKDIVEGENSIREAKDATCYLWGIIITSIVRLWEVTSSIYMAEHKCLPLYWDTDSVKLHVPDDVNIKILIDGFNNETGSMVEQYPALGAYDYEGTYYAFKSLGSKRYIACEKNKKGNYEWESTIAGLPKKVYSEFLTQILNKNLKYTTLNKAIEASAFYFKPNMYVDESATSKLIPKYVDVSEPIKLVCTDYLGKSVNDEFWPGARLSGIQFAIMSLESCENRNYQLLCNRMQNRISDDLDPLTVKFDYDRKEYTIVDGALNIPELKVYMYQRDVNVYV